MCNIMDDVVGWTAFMVTGYCHPWSGFTMQINTSLQKPIMVHLQLLVKGIVTKIEHCKVFVTAELVDPADQEAIHATCQGLVILNKGILPDSTTEQSTD